MCGKNLPKNKSIIGNYNVYGGGETSYTHNEYNLEGFENKPEIESVEFFDNIYSNFDLTKNKLNLEKFLTPKESNKEIYL
jgi:hypothetical protein